MTLLQKAALEIIDKSEDEDDDDNEKKILNLNELEDLIDCEKELKLNDPLLSSFSLFDSPPSSSHSDSIPSSPSSISTVSSTSKRSKSSTKHKQSSFDIDTDDDSNIEYLTSKKKKYFDREKKNEKEREKYYGSDHSIDGSATMLYTSMVNDDTDRVTSSFNLKDPMMSGDSPSHYSNDFMDHMNMFSMDLCTILKTEYDDEIMIG